MALVIFIVHYTGTLYLVDDRESGSGRKFFQTIGVNSASLNVQGNVFLFHIYVTATVNTYINS